MNIEEFYEKAKAIAGDKLVNASQIVGEIYGYSWCIHVIKNDRIVLTSGGETAADALKDFAEALAHDGGLLARRLDEARAEVARLEAELAAQTKTQNQ